MMFSFLFQCYVIVCFFVLFIEEAYICFVTPFEEPKHIHATNDTQLIEHKTYTLFT